MRRNAGATRHWKHIRSDTAAITLLSAIDVFNSLEWTAAGPCSQSSIENGGVPMAVPNFRDPAAQPHALPENLP